MKTITQLFYLLIALLCSTALFGQALNDHACVVYFVCMAEYPVTLDDVIPGSCDILWPADVDTQCGLSNGLVPLDPA